MGKADLHIHTCHDGWGDGNATVDVIFEYVETHTDLDLLALTDHDSTEAARAGRELHQRREFRFDFLPGTEVTTASGHVLCYFPGEIFDVPSLRSLAATTRFVHERGGFCVLAHPVYPPWLRRSLVKPHSRAITMVDAVEVMNGGLSDGARKRLDAMASTISTRTSVVGNSDSHHKESIGTTWTEFPGTSLAAYVEALGAHATRAVAGPPVAMGRRARSFTRRRSMTRPGWVRNVYREIAGKPGSRTP